MTGDGFGGRFADIADSEGIQYAVERCLLRILQAHEEPLYRSFLPSLEGHQMFCCKFIEICDVPHQCFIEQLLDRRFACDHIHSLSAEEMDQAAFDLRRAAGLVRAECLCFGLVLYKSCTAVGTCLREVGEDDVSASLAEFDSCDFRDDFSSLFHIDVVADVDVVDLHLLLIVERRSFHDCSAELDRFEVCDRGHCTCAADLVVDADELGECLLCLELVCYCPTRELCCVSEFFLIWKFVDFDYDAVGRIREVLPFGVPV